MKVKLTRRWQTVEAGPAGELSRVNVAEYTIDEFGPYRYQLSVDQDFRAGLKSDIEEKKKELEEIAKM